MSKDGHYLFDPDKTKNAKFTYAGAKIVYTNKKKRYADQLKITGPTTANLRIMVSIMEYLTVNGLNLGITVDFIGVLWDEVGR